MSERVAYALYVRPLDKPHEKPTQIDVFKSMYKAATCGTNLHNLLKDTHDVFVSQKTMIPIDYGCFNTKEEYYNIDGTERQIS